MAKKTKKAAKKPAKKAKAPKKTNASAKSKAKKQAKKPAKKAAPKKKKPVAKKPAKPAKKVIKVKKVKPVKAKAVKAKPVKKDAPKKVKPVKVKPAKEAKPVKPIVVETKQPKTEKAQKLKQSGALLDDESKKSDKASKSKSNEEFFSDFVYKPKIRKPLGDQPKPHIGDDGRTRYSDKELAEFKELINTKLEEAQRDYELLKATLSHKDDHGTDDTSPTFKLLEDGSDVLSKEETAQLAARQEKYIQNLKNALIRIENKSYGVCRVTGRLISKERLRSVPHATLDIDAKLDQHN